MIKIFPFSVIQTLSSFVFVSAVFFAPTTSAQSIDDIKACRSIADVKARLDCFDRATAEIDAPVPVETKKEVQEEEFAPVVRTRDGAGKKVDKKQKKQKKRKQREKEKQKDIVSDDDFGSENLGKDRFKEKAELHSVMTESTKNRFGKLTITLENGQVWRQVASDTNALFIPKKLGDGLPIIIKKGALGSHRLRLKRANRSILVRRIK